MDKRILLVLGGSSDMGMSLIASVAQNYEKIIAQYRTQSNALIALQKKLGEKMLLIQCDFLHQEEVENLADQLIEKGMIPSHIVHFAADRSKNQRFHKMEWENDFQKDIDISIRSLVIILGKLLPFMKQNHYGKVIVLLSYVVNNMPSPNIANYVTVKYALLGLVKALAVEYAGDGITVNAVSPGWVNTKFLDSQPEILIRSHAENSPIHRNLECEDVIPGIQFLLSDSADCINGQNILITCGE